MDASIFTRFRISKKFQGLKEKTQVWDNEFLVKIDTCRDLLSKVSSLDKVEEERCLTGNEKQIRRVSLRKLWKLKMYGRSELEAEIHRCGLKRGVKIHNSFTIRHIGSMRWVFFFFPSFFCWRGYPMVFDPT